MWWRSVPGALGLALFALTALECNGSRSRSDDDGGAAGVNDRGGRGVGLVPGRGGGVAGNASPVGGASVGGSTTGSGGSTSGTAGSANGGSATGGSEGGNGDGADAGESGAAGETATGGVGGSGTAGAGGRAGAGGVPPGGMGGVGGTPISGAGGMSGASGVSGSAAGGGGGEVGACGNGVCDSGERTRECPVDCAITYPDVGVDIQGAASFSQSGFRGLMWQFERTSYISWDAAMTYCSELTLHGYTDWRLPYAAEQQDVLGGCVTQDAETLCNACTESPLCMLWFSTEELNTWNLHQYGTCCAGAINFETGYVSWSLFKSNAIRARCVRNLHECDRRPCSASEICVQNRCLPPLPEN